MVTSDHNEVQTDQRRFLDRKCQYIKYIITLDINCRYRSVMETDSEVSFYT